MSIRILTGEATARLRELPCASVHACVTSPPYFGLRDYGTGSWSGGDPDCEHRIGVEDYKARGNDGGRPRPGVDVSGCRDCGAIRTDEGIGLERSPEEHIDALVRLFREVRRVLRPDGVLWLNYGDAYAGYWGGKAQEHTPLRRENNGFGLKHKDLMLMPSRVALALQADGWWLRSMMPWVKRNPMPESATDRPGTAVEYVFMLTHSARYFYDAEVVRHVDGGKPSGNDFKRPHRLSYDDRGQEQQWEPGGGRNFRNSDLFYSSLTPPHGLISSEDGPLALDVNLAGFAEAHFATFPPKLIEPLIKAATSEKGCCPGCGAPWVREVERTTMVIDRSERTHERGRTRSSGTMLEPPTAKTLGWSPSCACDGEPVPCTVLDPFGGAGTTGLVADRLGRDCILIELSPEYADMALRRLEKDGGMFAEVSNE